MKKSPQLKPVSKPVAVQKDPIAANRRMFLLYCLVIGAVFFTAYTNVIDEKINVNGDNIMYHILGKSLATGQGYVNINSPLKEAHNHFPPGYPFIISMFMRMGFTDISFFSMFNGVFGFGALIVFYLLLVKAGIDKRLSFVACLFTAINTSFLNYAVINMSEIPYLFFSLAALALLLYSKEETKFYKDYHFWGMAACVIISYYIRTSGIALLLAIIIYYLLRKKWLPTVTLVAGFALAIFPWMVRSSKLGGSDYMQQFLMKNPYRIELGKATTADFVHRVFANLSRYTAIELPSTFLPGQYSYLLEEKDATTSYWVAGAIITTLSIAGIIMLWKKQRVLSLYILGSAAILMLWPEVWVGARFMVPIIPFIILVILMPADYLARLALSKTKLRWSPLLFTAGLLAMIQPIRTMKDTASNPYPAEFQSYFTLAEWAKKNLPDTVTVCCRKPELFYLFSGLQTVNYAYTPDDTLILNNMARNSVDYVVIDQLGFSSTPKYLVPALQKHANQFDVVYQVKNPDTWLLKYKH